MMSGHVKYTIAGTVDTYPDYFDKPAHTKVTRHVTQLPPTGLEDTILPPNRTLSSWNVY